MYRSPPSGDLLWNLQTDKTWKNVQPLKTQKLLFYFRIPRKEIEKVMLCKIAYWEDYEIYESNVLP